MFKINKYVYGFCRGFKINVGIEIYWRELIVIEIGWVFYKLVGYVVELDIYYVLIIYEIV